jgi:hypothetical protein
MYSRVIMIIFNFSRVFVTFWYQYSKKYMEGAARSIKIVVKIGQ